MDHAITHSPLEQYDSEAPVNFDRKGSGEQVSLADGSSALNRWLLRC